MTLLIDLGNTRLKWAKLKADGTLSRQRAASHAGWQSDEFRHALAKTFKPGSDVWDRPGPGSVLWDRLARGSLTRAVGGRCALLMGRSGGHLRRARRCQLDCAACMHRITPMSPTEVCVLCVGAAVVP